MSDHTSEAPDVVFLLLQQLPRPITRVDFPRKDPVTGEPIGKIAMQVLSQQEQILAAISAETFTRNRLKIKPGDSVAGSIGYEDIYRNAVSAEVIQRACISANAYDNGDIRQFFLTSKTVYDMLTTAEIGKLLSLYLAFQADCVSRIDKIDAAELDFWVDALQQEGVTALETLSPEAKNELLVMMAGRVLELTPIG